MIYQKKNAPVYAGIIFRHLDGFSTSTSSLALQHGGILKLLEEKEKVTLSEVQSATNGNEGYINVALRILCSQGWLVQNILKDEQIEFVLTKKGRIAFEIG